MSYRFEARGQRKAFRPYRGCAAQALASATPAVCMIMTRERTVGASLR